MEVELRFVSRLFCEDFFVQQFLTLQQFPGNYYNRPCNKHELARLVTHHAFQRIAGFGNGMYPFYTILS